MSYITIVLAGDHVETGPDILRQIARDAATKLTNDNHGYPVTVVSFEQSEHRAVTTEDLQEAIATVNERFTSAYEAVLAERDAAVKAGADHAARADAAEEALTNALTADKAKTKAQKVEPEIVLTPTDEAPEVIEEPTAE